MAGVRTGVRMGAGTGVGEEGAGEAGEGVEMGKEQEQVQRQNWSGERWERAVAGMGVG